MNNERIAGQVIEYFIRSNTRIECPCCQEKMDLRRAHLFYLDDHSEKSLATLEELKIDVKERHDDLVHQRKKISQRSFDAARSVNLGFLLEKLAPTLGTFRFNRNDCRTLGEPIDLVIFDGMAKAGKVNRVFIGDIKTGAARLSLRQSGIKAAIEKKRVSFDIYEGKT